jgi:hypothetical protein
MSQFLQVNGDYTVKTKDEGTITFNTGSGVGTTRITGNLIVEGDTLTVSAENLDITDNVIRLNVGETGAGVTLTYAGIEIVRGTEPSASFVWDEDDDSFNIVLGSEGAYSYGTSQLRLKTILTDADTEFGDLTLIGTGTGVVKVLGTFNYEDQVTEDDDIPNKKYVDDSIQNSPSRQIRQDDSKILIADATVGGTNNLGDVVTETEIAVIVEGQYITTFYPNRVVLGDLEITEQEITTRDGISSGDITLRTNGTGKIIMNYGIQLENIAGTPTPFSGFNIIHTKTVNTGGSGVFFSNTDYNGELISNDRALLYSMLF